MEVTLQLPMRITLTALILVGSALPATLKEDHNATIADAQSPAKNASEVQSASNVTILERPSNSTDEKTVATDAPPEGKLTANATDAPEIAVKPEKAESSETDVALNKTETDASASAKKGQSVEPAQKMEDKVANATHGNDDVKNDNDNCTLSEQCDLLTSHVTPHDDDETTMASEPTQKSKTHEETTVAAVASDDTKVETTTQKMNPTTSESTPEAVTHLKNDSIEASHKDEPEDTGRTELLSSSTTSAIMQHAQTVQLESRAKSEGSDENGMPASIIALIAAITFAVVLAIVYISVLTWRRYLEFRYGHRELLVNDLEFDTNDLRHFEL